MQHKLQSRMQDGSRPCEGELHQSFFLPGGGNMNAMNAFCGEPGNMNGANIYAENELAATFNCEGELHRSFFLPGGGNMNAMNATRQ